MANDNFLGDDLTAAELGCTKARLETVAAGVPVFYRDTKDNADVMELPDGRKFEIRFLAGGPRERNYEVVRELGRETVRGRDLGKQDERAKAMQEFVGIRKGHAGALDAVDQVRRLRRGDRADRLSKR